MLNAFIQPSVSDDFIYSANIRYTSDTAFTHAKVVVARFYFDDSKVEYIPVTGYTNNIKAANPRTEDSFSVDLFNFEFAKDRKYRHIFTIQVGNSSNFIDLPLARLYHNREGLFKTSNNKGFVIDSEGDYTSLFKPETIQSVLTTGEFPSDAQFFASDAAFLTKDGSRMMVKGLSDSFVSKYTAEEIENALQNILILVEGDQT